MLQIASIYLIDVLLFYLYTHQIKKASCVNVKKDMPNGKIMFSSTKFCSKTKANVENKKLIYLK